MCGITGFISKDLKKADLVKMTDALSHRGPDASNCFIEDKKELHLVIVVKHCRPSKNANQPMTSYCGRYIMVYNGKFTILKRLQID